MFIAKVFVKSRFRKQGSSFYWSRQRQDSPFAEDFHHEVISPFERAYAVINALVAVTTGNVTDLSGCGGGRNWNFVNAETHRPAKNHICSLDGGAQRSGIEAKTRTN